MIPAARKAHAAAFAHRFGTCASSSVTITVATVSCGACSYPVTYNTAVAELICPSCGFTFAAPTTHVPLTARTFSSGGSGGAACTAVGAGGAASVPPVPADAPPPIRYVDVGRYRAHEGGRYVGALVVLGSDAGPVETDDIGAKVRYATHTCRWAGNEGTFTASTKELVRYGLPTRDW